MMYGSDKILEGRRRGCLWGKSKHKSPTEFCLTNDVNTHVRSDMFIEDLQFSRLDILVKWLILLNDLPCF